MTTDHPIRPFADAAAIRRVGKGLLARTLPRAEWTHEAHLAVCLWLVRERADLDLSIALPGIIRAYTESVGGVNDDSQGYHDTLTHFYLGEVRAHHAETAAMTLAEAVGALLNGARGAHDWPLRFYTRELLFSVEARRGYVPPDQQG